MVEQTQKQTAQRVCISKEYRRHSQLDYHQLSAVPKILVVKKVQLCSRIRLVKKIQLKSVQDDLRQLYYSAVTVTTVE